MVKKVLENLKTIYPFIGYTIVLSYMPREKKNVNLWIIRIPSTLMD